MVEKAPMHRAVHKRASAKRDLIDRYVYLAEQAGIETARFLSNADRSFRDSLEILESVPPSP